MRIFKSGLADSEGICADDLTKLKGEAINIYHGLLKFDDGKEVSQQIRYPNYGVDNSNYSIQSHVVTIMHTAELTPGMKRSIHSFQIPTIKIPQMIQLNIFEEVMKPIEIKLFHVSASNFYNGGFPSASYFLNSVVYDNGNILTFNNNTIIDRPLKLNDIKDLTNHKTLVDTHFDNYHIYGVAGILYESISRYRIRSQFNAGNGTFFACQKEDIEKLATILGVKISGYDDKWDFGKMYVVNVSGDLSYIDPLSYHTTTHFNSNYDNVYVFDSQGSIESKISALNDDNLREICTKLHAQFLKHSTNDILSKFTIKGDFVAHYFGDDTECNIIVSSENFNKLTKEHIKNIAANRPYTLYIQLTSSTK